MPTNVEIKARVDDLAAIRSRAEALAGSPGEYLTQEDTFFRTSRGRLKLRMLAPARAELIYYERTDAPGPKRSDYRVSPASDPAALRDVLSAALGIRGIVRKRRTLCIVGQTRIHLDEVEGLGDFVELEVVLRPGQGPDEGESIARDLMARLGIPADGLVAGAYLDLLERRAPAIPEERQGSR